MEIKIEPTPITIDANKLQSDVDTVLDRLVQDALTESFGDAFMYWLTTGSTTEWHGGDEYANDETSSSSSSAAAAAVSASAQRSSGSSSGGVPYTTVLYKGATVLIDTSKLQQQQQQQPQDGNSSNNNKAVDSDALQATVQTIIETQLVGALKQTQQTEQLQQQQQQQQQPQPYYEIESASVFWNTVIRNPPGNNIIVPVDDDDDQDDNNGGGGDVDGDGDGEGGLVEPPSDNNVSGDGTGVSVGKLEGNGNNVQQSDQNNWTASQTTGVVVGSFLLVSASLFFFVQQQRRRAARRRGGGAFPVANDLEMDQGHHEDDEDQRRHTVGVASSSSQNDDGTAASQSRTTDDAGTVQTNDASEMAHYQEEDLQYQQGELLECVSVASEWTLGTDTESSIFPNGAGSGSGGVSNHVRLHKAAEILAAKETFDRDRQVTLQKDMLQTEWTSHVMAGNSKPNAVDHRQHNKHNSLSFEQAHQGEEVYLMPPKSKRPSRRGPAASANNKEVGGEQEQVGEIV